MSCDHLTIIVQNNIHPSLEATASDLGVVTYKLMVSVKKNNIITLLSLDKIIRPMPCHFYIVS